MKCLFVLMMMMCVGMVFSSCDSSGCVVRSILLRLFMLVFGVGWKWKVLVMWFVFVGRCG